MINKLDIILNRIFIVAETFRAFGLCQLLGISYLHYQSSIHVAGRFSEVGFTPILPRSYPRGIGKFLHNVLTRYCMHISKAKRSFHAINSRVLLEKMGI